MRFFSLVALIVFSLLGCENTVVLEQVECEALQNQLKALPPQSSRSEFEIQLANDVFHQLRELKCLRF